MKRSRISMGLLSVLALVAISLWWSYGCGYAGSARTQSEATAKFAGPPQRARLGRARFAARRHQVRKPLRLALARFQDYQKHTQKFYESYGYSLPWVRGMEPTAQAQQMIALLLQAEQKDLAAEDYDGPRWSARLAKLKTAAPQPSEADAVRFDVALTVCLMRYISGLHVGKVNPKHFDFGLDIETKKYDLPEFLKENVADGSDVAGVVAKVEPPYPG
jgi:hypothetical protein